MNELKDIPESAPSNSVEETKSAIQLALNTLSAKEKVLVIAYSEGMSYRELSELTSINFNSIGKTLSRALKKLSEEMKKKDYGLY